MANVKYLESTATDLYVSLEGDVNANNAPAISDKLMKLVDKYPGRKIIIDAKALELISSAGLRGLVSLKKKINDTVAIINVPLEIYEIFEMTGFTKILEIHKRIRNISTDGCELIGQGANGKVYRLAKDSIVKVYTPETNMRDIQRERDLAEKSFVNGIPTAIAFDVVRTGDSFGVVFELLDAQSLSSVLAGDPENFDKYAKMYVELYRTFHTTSVAPDEFPSIKDIYHTYIDGCREWYTKDELDKLHRLVDSVPDTDTLIHGDYHPRNIMVQNDSLLMIDMGDTGRGHPVFDFLSTASTQANLVDLSPEFAVIHTGMPVELIKRLWNYLMEHYFEGRTKEEIERLDRQIRLFSKLKVAMAPVVGRGAGKAIIEASVNDARTNLIPCIDSLIDNFIW